MEEKIKNQERTVRIDIDKKILDFRVMITPRQREFDLSPISEKKLREEIGEKESYIKNLKLR